MSILSSQEATLIYIRINNITSHSLTMQRLDSTGHSSLDDSCSGEDWDTEAGVMLEVPIPDMRLEAEAGHCSRTVLEVRLT